MALVKCPECGKEISDKADECVHCGFVLRVQDIKTETIICPECGVELKKGVSVCGECGCPVINQKKKQLKPNKKIIITLLLILGIVAIAFAINFFMVNSDPVKKYISLFNSNEVEEAMSVYDSQIASSDEMVKMLIDEQNIEMDEIYQQFVDKKVEYDDSIKEISKYINFEPSEKYANKIKGKIDILNTSRKSYEEAQKAEQNDIELAIKKYKAVVNDDESYKDAQAKIYELETTYKSQLLSEAQTCVENKEYNKAISNVNQAISLFGSSDELEALKKEYTEMKTVQYAKIVVSDKSVTPKDSSNWIFANYVNFVFEITNNSDKSIKGIEGSLIINDLFGKKIIEINCDFTGNIIAPGEVYIKKGLVYECNQFNDDDMKLFNTQYSDLSFIYNISNIVYEDGTTVTPE